MQIIKCSHTPFLSLIATSLGICIRVSTCLCIRLVTFRTGTGYNFNFAFILTKEKTWYHRGWQSIHQSAHITTWSIGVTKSITTSNWIGNQFNTIGSSIGYQGSMCPPTLQFLGWVRTKIQDTNHFTLFGNTPTFSFDWRCFTSLCNGLMVEIPGLVDSLLVVVV